MFAEPARSQVTAPILVERFSSHRLVQIYTKSCSAIFISAKFCPAIIIGLNTLSNRTVVLCLINIFKSEAPPSKPRNPE
jgi:hypothetical protein